MFVVYFCNGFCPLIDLCRSGLRVVGATIQGSTVALSSEVAVDIPLAALIWTK